MTTTPVTLHADAGELITLASGPATNTTEAWVEYAANAALHALRQARKQRAEHADPNDYEDGDPESAGFLPEEFAGVGRSAYLSHLPLLTSRDNIRTYIAGIAAGVPIGVLNPEEASKLLYVAQTALSAARSQK